MLESDIKKIDVSILSSVNSYFIIIMIMQLHIKFGAQYDQISSVLPTYYNNKKQDPYRSFNFVLPFDLVFSFSEFLMTKAHLLRQFCLWKICTTA